MARPVFLATLICGTLDIVYALVMGVLGGGSAMGVLHSVASGPFGSVRHMGFAGALLGLAVHFVIMAVMVAAFAMLLRATPALRRWPWWLTGALYGLILYGVMYGIVLPARFGLPFPPADATQLVASLAAHIFLVGLPMAWLLIARRTN